MPLSAHAHAHAYAQALASDRFAADLEHTILNIRSSSAALQPYQLYDTRGLNVTTGRVHPL